jgi:hypothetical protein
LIYHPLHPEEEWIVRSANGDFVPETVFRHLKSCPQCRTDVAALKKIIAATAAAPEPSVRQRNLDRERSEEHGRFAATPEPSVSWLERLRDAIAPLFQPRGLGALALCGAACMLAVFMGRQFFSSQMKPPVRIAAKPNNSALPPSVIAPPPRKTEKAPVAQSKRPTPRNAPEIEPPASSQAEKKIPSAAPNPEALPDEENKAEDEEDSSYSEDVAKEENASAATPISLVRPFGTIRSDETLTFDWVGNPDATSYKISLDRIGPDGKLRPYSPFPLTVPGEEYEPETPLKPGKYQWRVVALNDSGEPLGRSSPARFEVVPGSAPR